MADHYGHRYRFRAKFVDRMPENVAQDLIAHELAHGIQSANGIRCVRQFADGRAHFVCQDGSDFGGFPEIEEDADCTMVRWGFDPGSVDRWGLDTGIIKTIDVPDSRTGMAVVSRRWDRTGK